MAARRSSRSDTVEREHPRPPQRNQSEAAGANSTKTERGIPDPEFRDPPIADILRVAEKETLALIPVA